ncbi:MAG: helix-turn-helix transcriptional regulator [Tissierellia bacterium]|nr:helix-turn-helix transcriptional regulator [Tissierellia bacterium]
MKDENIEKNIPLTETAFLVLLAMLKPNHGYGVLQMVESITKGRVSFGPGTLYGAINNLNKKGWIELVFEDKENRRKEYVATKTGKELVRLELERMKELVEEGDKILEGEK